MTKAAEAAATDQAVIGTAINQVMSGIKKLERDTTNQFAKYTYASIDKFLDMLRPLLTAAGLSIVMDQLSHETKQVMTVGDGDRGSPKERSLLYVTYGFRFIHKSGATWPEADTLGIQRTVSVPAGGAQAWGAAQSYALKQFARSVFMVATGEKEDADADEPVEIAAQPAMLSQNASVLMASVFVTDMKELKTAEEIEQRFTKLKAEGRGLAPPDKKQAMDAYIAALARVNGEEKHA